VRLLSVGGMGAAPDGGVRYRSIAGGLLAQTPDLLGLDESTWKVVTKRGPSEGEWADLRLAWLISKHVKSNAITLVREGMLLGAGAGQMSRVMSCRIAAWLARENGHLAGEGMRDRSPTANMGDRSETDPPKHLEPSLVAASDAFFPFSDGPKELIDAGVRAIIQPGGSKRDDETIRLCDEHDVAMIFTGARHFRH
jgi:phosphoribosylaminoimidazolecarboxamide formyltransferase/IMP cyclohydrolase